MGLFSMLRERLINLRKKKGYTQRDIADKLNISRATYTHYELGNRNPDYETLELLATIYKVSVDYLLGRTDNPIPDGNESKTWFDELRKITKDVGLDNIAFFDENKWKNLTPEDLVEVEKYFRYIVHKAKERKDKKE